MNYPDFSFEKRLWKKGFDNVAGIDEVGRGCFAGPVVAGCVVFEKGINIPDDIYINDSKKVTPKRRSIADEWIKENALCWGIGEVSAVYINRLGISKSTQIAFRKAVTSANTRMNIRIQYLLIDAFYIPYIRGYPAVNKSTRKGNKNRQSKPEYIPG